MIGNKWYIIDEFSRYASKYDQYAFVQKKAAIELTEFIKTRLSNEQKHRFFEVGCGTGLFTAEIIAQFPNADFHVSDISDEMISAIFNKLNAVYPGQLQFEVLDAEHLPAHFFTESDIITSAFTIQWFENPAESVKHLFTQIPTAKRAFISYLADGSFPEWKKFAEIAQVPYTGNPLPNETEIQHSFNEAGFECEIQTMWIDQSYDNALSFLNSIKHIGAGLNLNDIRLTPIQLRKLIKTWDLACPNSVQVKHKVVFLDIKKG